MFERWLLIFFGVWLLAISAIFFWFFRRINGLIKEAEGTGFLKTLDNILKKGRGNEKSLKELTQKLELAGEEAKFCVQKIGVVRFNPFNETGGDHSFSIALLDGKDNGVILTSLHTRERTRFYLKSIKKGKSDYELSEEEKKAIMKAQKRKD